MVLISMHENAELQEHTSNGNIAFQILDGEINFFAEEQIYPLGKVQMITLEANIPYRVTSL